MIEVCGLAEYQKPPLPTLELEAMRTTEKLANVLAKFSVYAVVLVGLPLIVFSGAMFVISELQREISYGTCLESKALDEKVTLVQMRVCRR